MSETPLGNAELKQLDGLYALYELGTQVAHQKYGRGVIIGKSLMVRANNFGRIAVLFDSGVCKEFSFPDCVEKESLKTVNDQ